MVGEVQGAVAVGHGHAGEVPEYKHEAPFFVVHVPIRVKENVELVAVFGLIFGVGR